MKFLSALIAAMVVSVGSNAQDVPFAAFDLASEPVLNDPHDLAFGPDGRLYVADKFGARIAVFDPDTLELITMLGEGRYPGIHDISFGPDGLAYIAITGSNRVDAVRIDGDTLETVHQFPGLARTEGALAHSNGRLYAMASGTGDLVMFVDGKPTAAIGGLFGAHDVAEAPDGTIWVGANRQSALVHLTPQLDVLEVMMDPDLGFLGPRYLDIDEFGRLIVADQDAHRVLLIDPLAEKGSRLIGVIGDGVPGVGPGKFDDPEGVAVRGSRYYFADSDNNRIVRYSVVTH